MDTESQKETIILLNQEFDSFEELGIWHLLKYQSPIFYNNIPFR